MSPLLIFTVGVTIFPGTVVVLRINTLVKLITAVVVVNLLAADKMGSAIVLAMSLTLLS